jgi:hypothetical protein
MTVVDAAVDDGDLDAGTVRTVKRPRRVDRDSGI